MKSFIALCIVSLIASSLALTEEQLAKAEGHKTHCLEQNEGLTVEEITALRNGEFSNPSDKLKCFANCFLERAEVMKDGALQEDVALAKLSTTVDPALVQKVIDACKDTKGEDNCDTAFKLYECYYTNKAQLF